MVRNSGFSGSVTDASGGKLVEYASYKASSVGKRVALVDPSETNQVCARCGKEAGKPLWVTGALTAVFPRTAASTVL
jgi:transposase